MKRFFVLATALSLGLASIGCDRKSSSTVTEKVKTPEGSTTKTTETKIESSGDHPPSAPSGGAVPPK